MIRIFTAFGIYEGKDYIRKFIAFSILHTSFFSREEIKQSVHSIFSTSPRLREFSGKEKENSIKYLALSLLL